MKTLEDYGIKELRDGLTLERLEKDFNWILEADITDAVIGVNELNEIIFYDGVTCQGGTWHNETWDDEVFSGCTWHSGTWSDELWEGNF